MGLQTVGHNLVTEQKNKIIHRSQPPVAGDKLKTLIGKEIPAHLSKDDASCSQYLQIITTLLLELEASVSMSHPEPVSPSWALQATNH